MTGPAKRGGPLLLACVTGALAGIGHPYLDLALACRVPDSEACVWGKAYLPLSLGIAIPTIGGLVAVVTYALWKWLRRG